MEFQKGDNVEYSTKYFNFDAIVRYQSERTGKVMIDVAETGESFYVNSKSISLKVG